MTRRAMTIRAALEWAFATEHAQLDFAEELGDSARPGISTIWTIMQRGHLGCSVDGGGRSLPHHEADMIASAVAHLPQHLGGRGMAVLVAECARAGQVPDWRTEPPRWTAREWKGRHMAHGLDAETELVGVEVITLRGRQRHIPVYACPIKLTVSPKRAIAARDRYTAWRAALSYLAQDLRGRLREVQIAPGLPPAAPWEDAHQVQQVA